MSFPERPGLSLKNARNSWESEGRSSSSTENFPRHSVAATSQLGKESFTTTAPPPRIHQHRLAEQNERHKSFKEGPANLEAWDSFHYHWLKLLAAFGNWNNRQILKNISASPQVLGTYHDSFLFGEVPVSVKARSALRSGLIGTIWQLMEFVLALLSGVLYVFYLYRSDLGYNWIFRVQNAISIAFLADYGLRVYSEPVRLYFIFSVWGVVDLLSTIPVILVFRNSIRGASIIRLLQFVRIVRISSLIGKVNFFGRSVTQQIFILSISTFGVVFLDAGILQWVEYHLAPPSIRASCSRQGCITFWESLYFLVVTISTVGYGDITPKTIIGQLVAILTIIAALTILPIQIGRITALAFRRPYGGSFRARKVVGSRFLIISGSVTFAAVQNFLAEFYNPTHSEGAGRLHYIGVIKKRCVDLIFDLPDLEVYPLRIIILAPFAPSFELKQLLSLYNGLVEFIEGSPVRQSDLERVSADRASAFFLLADKDSEDYRVEDAAQVVRALAVHRFFRSNRNEFNVRIIVEVLDPDTHTSAVWDEAHTGGIEVICPVKVHYKMMARGCYIHGLYTFITNLFTSELQLKYLNRKHFLTEYFHSFDNEIYPVVFPQAFHGLSFQQVAEFVYVNFNSTLFAVDTITGYKSNGQVDRKVLLHPRGHQILSDDVGLVIATSLHTAYAISTYQNKEQKDGLLHQLWVRAMTRKTIKRHNQGTELLDPVSGKWRRSNSSVSRATFLDSAGSMTATAEEGVPGVYPNHRHGNRKLEHELRSAIQTEYTTQEYPNWGKAAVEVGILQGCDVETPLLLPKSKLNGKAGIEEVTSGSGSHFRRGLPLQKAAEELLAWPPFTNDKPHPAVIEEKQEVILENLRERTIAMVAFNIPHILVCCQAGWPENLFYFLLELRRAGFPNPPVVILYPKEVTVQQWGTVGVFSDVFYIKGSPIYELDLLRGGVLQAEQIVVLSDQGLPVDLGGDSNDKSKFLKRTPAAYTSDVENVVIAANVQRLYGHDSTNNVIVEMQHTDAFYYLRPQYDISSAHFPTNGLKRNRDALVHFIPPFMQGKAVSSSMLGFLMRSSFYNRNTQSIVDQLIQGGHILTEEGLSSERPRILDQIPLPEQYGNRPYSDLFLGLLRENDLLVLGLYRVRGTLGAPTAYVLTNPLPSHIMNPDDLVYILR